MSRSRILQGSNCYQIYTNSHVFVCRFYICIIGDFIGVSYNDHIKFPQQVIFIKYDFDVSQTLLNTVCLLIVCQKAFLIRFFSIEHTDFYESDLTIVGSFSGLGTRMDG